MLGYFTMDLSKAGVPQSLPAAQPQEEERELREAIRLKEELLLKLAHELRNPLAPIRNALEIIRLSENTDPAAVAGARQLIERQLQKLVKFIDELLHDISCGAENGLHRQRDFVSPNGSTARRRVLVADDNHDSTASLAMLLEMQGYDVRCAGDGLEALEIAEEFRPNVVLLDIGMPRLDGYGAARELRNRVWTKETVLVAITGWGQDEDKRLAREAGFNHHVIKPVDPETLRGLIELDS